MKSYHISKSLHKLMWILRSTCLMQNGTDNLLNGLKLGFNIKPSKTENDVESNMKSTTRYAFVPPGAIRKGQGRGRWHRSLVDKENMPIKSLFPQSSDLVKQYIQTIETSTIGKGRGQGLKRSTMSTSQGPGTIRKDSIVLEKEYMQIDSPLPPSTDQIKQYTQKIEARKGREQTPRSSCSSLGISKCTRSNFTISSNQEMRTMDKNSLVLEKSICKPIFHCLHLLIKLCNTPKQLKHVKRVRGRNKCKEVASLEVGQKLKVTFYNNRTVGTNNKLFLRHLGRIIRDCNMSPLGVSSWNDIKEEKLNHMCAAIEKQIQSQHCLCKKCIHGLCPEVRTGQLPLLDVFPFLFQHIL
uniref:Uncharacterized protein LOC104244966 isoform X4 n=1 Tax=Nicotiana sylvestris TaxID=4096 RepID=A0A1U7Y6P8_NICSY|nr:PREDICTED: uncharacterized protein LOC104244966 isoform X4 [Nicotiana sylvestris]